MLLKTETCRSDIIVYCSVNLKLLTKLIKSAFIWWVNSIDVLVLFNDTLSTALFVCWMGSLSTVSNRQWCGNTGYWPVLCSPLETWEHPWDSKPGHPEQAAGKLRVVWITGNRKQIPLYVQVQMPCNLHQTSISHEPNTVIPRLT